MKKIIKIIIILLIIFLVLFLINLFRNYFILNKIYNLGNNFNHTNNYHIKEEISTSFGQTTIDYYYKDNVYINKETGLLQKMESIENNYNIEITYEENVVTDNDINIETFIQ